MLALEIVEDLQAALEQFSEIAEDLELVTVFLVVGTRGAEGLKRLLGESFAGIVGSDRWSTPT